MAQSEAVHWQGDLESAKTVAKQTNRLVLIHFWATTCGPCVALEKNVFSQPSVAGAIEAQFVPVKLNADQNTATAEYYGISRVPTDVVITPDGQVVGKLISPPTPGAYVAELTSVANQYATRLGQQYAQAATNAPVPSQINSAYANLPISQNVAAAAAPTMPHLGQEGQSVAAMSMGTVGGRGGTFGSVGAAATGNTGVGGSYLPSAGAASSSPIVGNTQANAGAVGGGPAIVGPPPLIINNVAARPVSQSIPAHQIAQQPVGSSPAAVNNPYFSQAGAGSAGAALAGQGAVAQYGSTANAYVAPNESMAAAAPVVSAAPAASSIPAVPVAAAGLAPGSYGFAQAIPNPPAATTMVGATGASSSPVASSNVAPSTSAVPDPRLLPPGAPALAFDGYCAVSMRNTWKWIPGNPQYGIVHLGRTYWFAGPEEQKQFWTDPARYAPALSGNDPVMAIDHRQNVPGKREHSLDYDGLFYMFASEATLQQFTANPSRYAASVRQAMGLPRGRLVR
ncbi:MAG: thioredoxin family protein [Pirellulales bacterium]|nr:thioredoxin family protein [Pirellulales bacterium]